MRLARLILTCSEGATEGGIRAQQREQARGAARRLQLFRLAAAGQCGKKRCVGREVAHGFEAVVERDEFSFRNRHLGFVGPEAHDAIGVGIGQRPQQHRIDDAEDRGVRADAECERQHREGRERTRASHGAEGVAHVLCELFERHPPPGVAAGLAQQQFIAKAAAGRRARLFRARAGTAMLLLAQFAMQPHFFAQVEIEAPATEQHAQSAEKHSHLRAIVRLWK